MADFNLAVKHTLDKEGGLSNDMFDLGGLTKFGISSKSYPNEDIENMTIDRAKFLYKRDYWDVIKGDQINSQKVAESIFDFAVNAGVKTSSRLAQKVIGSNPDGIIGPNTLSLLNGYDWELFVCQFALLKIERYCEIVGGNPSQLKFLRGWTLRSLELTK